MDEKKETLFDFFNNKKSKFNEEDTDTDTKKDETHELTVSELIF